MGELELLPDEVRLVILDRDGTIVEGAAEGDYLIDPADVRLLPWAAPAIARWNRDGRRVVVATNQRCVALGLCARERVDEVNARVSALLAEQDAHIDEWYVCAHGIEECECRKPLPGLLLRAMADAGVGPESAVMIGDSAADAGAAYAAGIAWLRVSR